MAFFFSAEEPKKRRSIHSVIGAATQGVASAGPLSGITVLELAEIILRLTGSGSPLEFRPAPQDDPVTRRPDIAKAAALLGWAPVVPLTDGLARTITWQRSLSAIQA